MLEGLTGKRLLILEDGFFLDDATRRIFEAANVLFKTVSGRDGIAYLDEDAMFDGAIIDMDVEADTAFLVSERLEALGVPFLFALSDRDASATSRYKPFCLCSDLDELNAIKDGLFGAQGLQ
jgi:hypothetical protein